MTARETDKYIDDVGLPLAAKKYRVAGVLFTYRCSIRCRHCLFCSAPDRPDVVMTARQCADALAALHETGRIVHIAGGEAMVFWETLKDSIRLAHSEGNAPHFIETNCSFATKDSIVRERLEFLADHGMKGILASADPYHQEHVPADSFLRLRSIAREIFGEKNFWGAMGEDDGIREYEPVSKDDALMCEYVRSHPPIMVGTAFNRLTQYLDKYDSRDEKLPVIGWHEGKKEAACSSQFLSEEMWELHIDPYGNIQTNCGMILGRFPESNPARLLKEGPEKVNRFVEAVCTGGAKRLAELATAEYGFTWPEKVSQTCELCYVTRRFLRQHHPDVFGPEEIYT